MTASVTPPAGLTLLEQQAHFYCALLYDLHGNDTYPENTEGPNIPLVTGRIGKARDGSERAIYRVSFEIHPEWKSSVNPLWTDTLQFANVLSLPAGYQ